MLAPELLPVCGGVGTYIIDLVRHMPKETEVHVVTPMRKGFGPARICSSDYDFSKYFGSNVHIHFISNANDSFVYNGKFQFNCFRKVPQLVKEYGLDLVHSHTAHMPDLLLRYRGLKTPFVSTIHTTIGGQREGTKGSGMGFSGLAFSEKLTYLTFPFLSLAEAVYFSRSRYYITVSNWMKELMIQKFLEIEDSNISVIHNSVNVERYSPGKKRGLQRDIILITGRLVAAKGIGYLVEAMPRVIALFPDALFIFIGPGNSFPYKKRLQELGVSRRNFLFLGYLKDANSLVEYYRSASVFLAPTLYENLPIRVLEAMACGVAVVASNVCAVPEVIENGVNGLLVRPGSVVDLSNAICCLLSDPDLRRKLGENARRTVLEKFNWRLNAPKISNVYEDILNNSNQKVLA